MPAVQKKHRIVTDPATVTAFLLTIPLIAMQFTSEVVWSLSDFIIAGMLLMGTGIIYKLLTRRSARTAYRVATGFALLSGLFLIWANLAVGIIGSENNAFNLIYFAVIAIGLIGAPIVRYSARRMALVMGGMSVAVILITILAFLTGMHQIPASSVAEVLGINALFVTIFAVSGMLCRNAALDDENTG